MADKLKILLITLAYATLSHATVLRWLGLTNNNQEIPVSYPPQTHPIQAQHVVLQSPDVTHRLLNVRYVNSPLLNIVPPTPLSFLNFAQARHPFLPGPVLIGPPVGLVISNGQAVVGKPDNVEQGPISSSENSVQFLSQGDSEDSVHPVYIHDTIKYNNNYPDSDGQLHTAAELVRPVFSNNFRPSYTGNSNSQIPQQYPIPSSDSYNNNNNNNNVYTPSYQLISKPATSQPFLFPTYQQLPYPSSPINFRRPSYSSNSELLPPPEPTNKELVQQQQPTQSSDSEDFTNSVAFPPNGEQTENVDQHSYELENGTKVSEQTNVVTSADGNNNQLVKSGEYEYIDDNGSLVKVKWVADENGFRIIS